MADVHVRLMIRRVDLGQAGLHGAVLARMQKCLLALKLARGECFSQPASLLGCPRILARILVGIGGALAVSY